MYRKITFILLVILWVHFPSFADAYSSRFKKDDVAKVMKAVADWQIAHFKEVRHNPVGWQNAAMYVGMVDWAALAETRDKDNSYYRFLTRIFGHYGWQPAYRMYHADDICVAQVYIDLYQKYKRKGMINPTIARTDWVMKNPAVQTMKLGDRGVGQELWTWCDALFMAPPVYAKLYALTGEKRYIRYMNQEYAKTYNYLYDHDEHLFFRDWRYFDKKEKNGEKIFWGRGNGWVLGGLCEILKVLPPKDRNRKFYEGLFVEMAGRLASLQLEDGFWHASLLDPESYPSPETSATGFILYGLAYGINAGLLPAEKFMPVVEKGWKAMVSAVEADGKLGYVQPVAADPFKVTREMTEVYGVGAFLLLGNEIYNMSDN